MQELFLTLKLAGKKKKKRKKSFGTDYSKVWGSNLQYQG